MRRGGAALLAAFVIVMVGCAPTGSADPSSPGARTGAPTSTPTTTRTPTADPIEALTLRQRVGQLFMVGTAAETASPDALAAVSERHVGGLFLHGRSSAGAEATAGVVAQFTGLAQPGGIRLWVATDQEGGEVQVLRGPGFEDMPYAIRQADDPPAVLAQKATVWGQQLRAAGVDMNLAPVADIVTSHDTRFSNPPIGALGRQYGYDRQTVAARAGAFAAGMRAAGVMPTFKHFPGLGRVESNTDHVQDVVDDTVGTDSPDVDVYRDLTAAGPSVVMVGTAVYARIDGSTPAAFSPVVVTDLLRGRVGFDGVVTTDDLSAAAAAQAVPVAERGVRAIEAGVDLVLVSADPTVLAVMYDAVLGRAETDPGFAERVDESARRVVAAKAAAP